MMKAEQLIVFKNNLLFMMMHYAIRKRRCHRVSIRQAMVINFGVKIELWHCKIVF